MVAQLIFVSAYVSTVCCMKTDRSSLDVSRSTVDATWGSPPLPSRGARPITGKHTKPQEEGMQQEEQLVRQEEDWWVEEEERHQQAARQE